MSKEIEEIARIAYEEHHVASLYNRAFVVLMKLCLDNGVVSASGEFKRLLLGLQEDLFVKKIEERIRNEKRN